MMHTPSKPPKPSPKKASKRRSSTCARCFRSMRNDPEIRKKDQQVLVVHEDTKTGGIAGEIAAILCEKAFAISTPAHARRVPRHARAVRADAEDYFLPNAKKVFTAAKELARY